MVHAFVIIIIFKAFNAMILNYIYLWKKKKTKSKKYKTLQMGDFLILSREMSQYTNNIFRNILFLMYSFINLNKISMS
jgi:hypothetical protein